MGPPFFSGHVPTLPSTLPLLSGAPLLPCTCTETGEGTGLRKRHVVSQENPLSLVTALLMEGLDALLKG